MGEQKSNDKKAFIKTNTNEAVASILLNVDTQRTFTVDVAKSNAIRIDQAKSKGKISLHEDINKEVVYVRDARTLPLKRAFQTAAVDFVINYVPSAIRVRDADLLRSFKRVP